MRRFHSGFLLASARAYAASWFGVRASPGRSERAASEPPIRAGLFSVHQLEQHAITLAGTYRLSTRRTQDKLIPRLAENERVLLDTYDLLAGAVAKGYQITPAAEWLLDNFYVMEEQVLTARKHFPRSYGRSLPKLADGPGAGTPRVYAMALEFVSHVDGAVDNVNLGAFITSYQSATPLSLGELWAIPIMLRLALIENLRRIAVRLTDVLHDRDAAAVWADKLLEVVELNPSDIVLVLADMARAAPSFTSAFVAELMRRLHGQSPHFALAQSWLEHRIAEQGPGIAQLVQMESQSQAADQISVGNSINSLRKLSSFDWRDFVEEQSLVERILHRDPAGVYAGMDFATRNRYRGVVEKLARRGGMAESAVAEAAIRLAALAPPDVRRGHVGYYLIDNGKAELEAFAVKRRSIAASARKLAARRPLLLYLSSTFVLTAAIMLALLEGALQAGASAWVVALCFAPASMCAFHVALGLANLFGNRLVPPRLLPSMDFRGGIPAEHRTMVVVPSMLGTPDAIRQLLERIELHYIANRDAHLHFALLTDFKDAAEEHLPTDAEQTRLLAEGIAVLAQRYADERSDIFYAFHRPRLWCECDKTWRGRERKRGKLEDFNALLRGNAERRFELRIGDPGVLSSIRYVITLDTDTQLPRDAAREMVGAMAHVLNRPVLDASGCRVIAGHGVMQPRVAINLLTARNSWFVRMCVPDSGLDPYTRVVSDVYQDFFGEGSFIGKGIYDVDAFRATCGNFPDNAILSHDLLEGLYSRSALLTGVEIFEDYPSRYAADAARRHRWIRGDWQIAAWVFRHVPGRGGTRARNSVSLLSRWKVLDNLRRSLVPPSLLLLLLLAWLLPSPGLALTITIFALLAVGGVPLLSALAELNGKSPQLSWHLYLWGLWPANARRAAQFFTALSFLPHEAFLSLDAIVRTLHRVLWSRRNLLEWTASADAERRSPETLAGHLRFMASAPLLAIAAAAAILVVQPATLPISAPLLALWLLSPALAWYISRPAPAPEVRLSQDQMVFLRTIARKTWRYFEVFVGEEENWLPPDNFQETPAPKIASRTSPTNLGMALLSNLAAHDFGYLSTAEFIHRTRNTLAGMSRLERHRGHFYNWYDTRTLEPLQPLYVSTVDSGNLAMHLLVLKHGVLQLADAPLLPSRYFEGLQDTLRSFADAERAASSVFAAKGVASSRSLPLVRSLLTRLEHPPSRLHQLAEFLVELGDAADRIAVDASHGEDAQWWAKSIQSAIAGASGELRLLAPWAFLRPSQEEDPAIPQDLLAQLDAMPTLRGVVALAASFAPQPETSSTGPDVTGKTIAGRNETLQQCIAEGARNAAVRLQELESLARNCAVQGDMDFTFLYDQRRDLFSIGYNIGENRLDNSFYDLLASESRMASYYAIAQGQLSQDHWFALRRMLTMSSGRSALLSWNGSMFEYLMPLLVMPTHENTLLDQTYDAIVQRQISFGRQQGIPWGISESGYNARDTQHNYQYRGFGVPGLGLKRGLAEDRVVAPYATQLALMVAPAAACKNLERLAAEGQVGAFGFYEAIDYTPSRLPRGAEHVTIRSFMVHHQGMGLLSLAYVLLDRPMQRRFGSDPAFHATGLLLQERIPRMVAPIYPHAIEVGDDRPSASDADEPMRVVSNPSLGAPEIHLLSNGRLHVMVSSGGGGYSRRGDIALTRWREDPTRDCWGSFCYLRDLETGKFWSTSHQPTLEPAEGYEAVFVQAKAEFKRRDEGIELHTEISVSPEDDIELRRTTITNRSGRARRIELTSYAEVVLAPPGQDLTHPAFSNLFVQTEILRENNAILCTRRPRSADEHPLWLVHLMTVRGKSRGEASFESSRLKFIGRGRTAASPAALAAPGPLSGSDGCVLDPIVAIRRVVLLQPNESTQVDIVTGIAENREAVTGLAEKYQDPGLCDRVFELALTNSQVELRHINASEADAQRYLRLAGSVVYAASARRASADVLKRNQRAQSGLWGHGISGDLPIVLVRIREREKLDLVRQAIQTHAYWRLKGLVVDLVIWTEDESVYRQDIFETILELIAASPEAPHVDKPGGVFLRRGEQIPEDDRILLQAAARVVLADDAGTMREQIDFRRRAPAPVPPFKPVAPYVPAAVRVSPPRADLEFFNGLGGFTHDGREYITVLHAGMNTPAPWCNVIANPNFGTVVSESGSVYTWAENCHEFRLTPWSNDPVSGVSGEAVYLRDEETGRVWSPTPQGVRGKGTYVARHGFGYSVFEHQEEGIASELTLYVDMELPVKYLRLKLTNQSGRPRRISGTAYWELVLGELRCNSIMHIVTEIDAYTGAVFARNPYSTEFGGRVAFFHTSEINHSLTGDRGEFLGRNGSIEDPMGMHRARLSGRVGAGFDPCVAMQVPQLLEDGETREIVFALGAARSEEEARDFVHRTRGAQHAQASLQGVWDYWGRALGAVYVETPDTALNYLVNGWLVYQTLACRLWARTGFYQSGGAFGFRDQLQDTMALVHTEPGIVRAHLLRAAARQFAEGDVQHWWHAHSGRGVRTHFSDDYLWLPLAACRYVAATGDTGVLEEMVPYLEGRAVRPEEEGYYDLPQSTGESGTLYDHCRRAVRHGLRFGAHGLPLMGCGDWNDGMNLVGREGKGESVWLAFFLHEVMTGFASLARQHGDEAFAAVCLVESNALAQRIEANAWDGQWYRRAYFDDGQPLGSSQNSECQIDSIAQSWAVLSAAGDPARARQAMNSVDARLVRRDARLIQLFDPPFDKSDLDPGYIKGYSPGVRENGGQYTHAAIWTAMAFAKLGDNARAWEMFNLLNPVTHAQTPEDMRHYRVEPYVVAADVYGAEPHVGKGGWTWYTGSASWMYRLITESLLGIHLEVDHLRFTSCLPGDWNAFTLHYRFRETYYHIAIHQGEPGANVKRILLDGQEVPGGLLPLVDDRASHTAEVHFR